MKRPIVLVLPLCDIAINQNLINFNWIEIACRHGPMRKLCFDLYNQEIAEKPNDQENKFSVFSTS